MYLGATHGPSDVAFAVFGCVCFALFVAYAIYRGGRP